MKHFFMKPSFYAWLICLALVAEILGVAALGLAAKRNYVSAEEMQLLQHFASISPTFKTRLEASQELAFARGGKTLTQDASHGLRVGLDTWLERDLLADPQNKEIAQTLIKARSGGCFSSEESEFVNFKDWMLKLITVLPFNMVAVMLVLGWVDGKQSGSHKNDRTATIAPAN